MFTNSNTYGIRAHYTNPSVIYLDHDVIKVIQGR